RLTTPLLVTHSLHDALPIYFGNRVLHLDPGVHLDEEELAILVEKLEGAGTAITQIDTGLYAAGLNFCAGLLVDARRGGLFDDLRSEEHTSELQSRENLVCRL